METALETYRRVIASQPTCNDSFFTESLARYRSGDESAARDISGSCLRLALQLVEHHSADPASPSFDAIQEANAGLMDAITTFAGDDLHDFLRYAQDRIQQRLAALA
jgi:DNA-directed RNA polymerase sigma subunit (sigma70/sigma32)